MHVNVACVLNELLSTLTQIEHLRSHVEVNQLNQLNTLLQIDFRVGNATVMLQTDSQVISLLSNTTVQTDSQVISLLSNAPD